MYKIPTAFHPPPGCVTQGLVNNRPGKLLIEKEHLILESQTSSTISTLQLKDLMHRIELGFDRSSGARTLVIHFNDTTFIAPVSTELPIVLLRVILFAKITTMPSVVIEVGTQGNLEKLRHHFEEEEKYHPKHYHEHEDWCSNPECTQEYKLPKAVVRDRIRIMEKLERFMTPETKRGIHRILPKIIHSFRYVHHVQYRAQILRFIGLLFTDDENPYRWINEMLSFEIQEALFLPWCSVLLCFLLWSTEPQAQSIASKVEESLHFAALACHRAKQADLIERFLLLLNTLLSCNVHRAWHLKFRPKLRFLLYINWSLFSPTAQWLAEELQQKFDGSNH